MSGDQISVAVLSSLSKRLQEIFCTVKGPIPASAVTLRQQPRIGGKYQYIIGVDISWPDGCTLCATFGPTLANTRQCLGWWRHYLQIHRKSPSAVSDLLARDVLTRQAARDGRLRAGLLSL
ncbi:hypothetical protein T03_5046 [Trichinella britovi]|uniref:Uncharacterized protein n=1 Tax=Trichinella britovi TaxID=45882 RepID=A0A0V1AN93_TRIBR|nr:hypothetical protein T03_5046 [Trichinella britovi]